LLAFKWAEQVEVVLKPEEASGVVVRGLGVVVLN
jgi:hypothetical protein